MMVVFYTKSHFSYKSTGMVWSHIITKLILLLRQNSLFLQLNLIILFEYPQSISGDDFLSITHAPFSFNEATHAPFSYTFYIEKKKEKKKALIHQPLSIFFFSIYLCEGNIHFFNGTFLKKIQAWELIKAYPAYSKSVSATI